MNFATLPNLIALAVLVAVFWAISRKDTSERLHLWLAGWFLILLHFTAQFLSPATGPDNVLLDAISDDCLILAGVAFVISVSTVATTWRRQLLMTATIAVPCLAFPDGGVWGIASRPYYYSIIAVGGLAPMILFWRLYNKSNWYTFSV